MIFLLSGANTNARDAEGLTALCWAAMKGNVIISKLLPNQTILDNSKKIIVY